MTPVRNFLPLLLLLSACLAPQAQAWTGPENRVIDQTARSADGLARSALAKKGVVHQVKGLWVGRIRQNHRSCQNNLIDSAAVINQPAFAATRPDRVYLAGKRAAVQKILQAEWSKYLAALDGIAASGSLKSSGPVIRQIFLDYRRTVKLRHQHLLALNSMLGVDELCQQLDAWVGANWEWSARPELFAEVDEYTDMLIDLFWVDPVQDNAGPRMAVLLRSRRASNRSIGVVRDEYLGIPLFSYDPVWQNTEAR